METEEIVCPLEAPLPPGRKAILYAASAAAIAACMFLFFAALG